MRLQIFLACVCPSEPPHTVKSWLKVAMGRPSTRPVPVTTPSVRETFIFQPEMGAVVIGMHAPLLKCAGQKKFGDPVARGLECLSSGVRPVCPDRRPLRAAARRFSNSSKNAFLMGHNNCRVNFLFGFAVLASFGAQNSVSTPNVDLGCKNATIFSRRPFKGHLMN